MKIAVMLRDVLSGLLHRPATQRYPLNRVEPPARLRAKLHWKPADCTGCALCVKDCPADAIELITIDKASKRFVMRYDLSRCVFCGQCTQNCRFDCLTFTHDEWELAGADKAAFVIYYGDAQDVANLLAHTAGPATDTSLSG